tara:strand:- start:773 stop:1078 length:306 start_codon:yes stop_codon:yes gene_type:complete
MTEKYYEIPKLINLTKSYLFFDVDSTWRTNINSILINENENETYYLAKECRTESVGKNPFLNSGRYEFLAVVEKDRNIYFFRTSLLSSKGTMQKNTWKELR